MRQMAYTVNEIKDDVGEIKGGVGKIREGVGEIKDDVGKIKDDVGETKCLCSFTCIVSIVQSEASPQGTRSNRMFENGFPRQTRP